MRLVWTEEEFGTGVEVVDAQHRELFERANFLLDAAAGLNPEREFRLTLQFLSSYVVTHFATEERAMALVGCPTAALNREQHIWFVERLGEVQGRLRDEGVTLELVEDVKHLLLSWIGDHIRDVDAVMRTST